MSAHWQDAMQVLLYFACVFALAIPLGRYMAKVYSNHFVTLEWILAPIENFIYKTLRINPSKEMHWQEYAMAVLFSSFIGFLLLFVILRFQAELPFNPQQFNNLSNALAFNTAVSFITNTNWQSYGGEFTLSYTSQMLGLTVQNFLSAAMGMAVLVALIRGFIRRETSLIGNFWVDMTRGCLYILLPLSLVLGILLGSQGVIQNVNPYIVATKQVIPGGAVASQVAIKQLGSNGGGFFNTNSATPYENPTPFSNFLEMISILLIPLALCFTFGHMVSDKRQSWAIIASMMLIFLPLFMFNFLQEQKGNILLQNYPVNQLHQSDQSGGNMQGKEVRFGILNSTLWTSLTTATSNGSVNSMLDAYTPLGGMVPMMFLFLSEVIFGGVGCGLYGFLLFVLVTVFLAGLMVGRTPEYLGKKIQSFEIKMASIGILIPIMALLFGAAVAALMPEGKAGVGNPNAQGFSEILYALASTSGNNGSSFAGLDTATPFYSLLLGVVMLFGRYWIIIPVLALAGSLAQKGVVPQTSGTLSTHTYLFIILVIGVMVLVGLLTYVPVLTLAPISEYFQWTQP